MARPGPALGGVQHSPVSQPQASQPLKGVSDTESRDHITGPILIISRGVS